MMQLLELNLDQKILKLMEIQLRFKYGILQILLLKLIKQLFKNDKNIFKRLDKNHSEVQQDHTIEVGALLVYDVTKEDSFYDLNKWIMDVSENANKDLSVVVLGNKTDLDNREVKAKQGEAFASERNFLFYETSALNGDNINQAFYSLAKNVLHRINDKQIDLTDQVKNINNFKLTEQTKHISLNNDRYLQVSLIFGNSSLNLNIENLFFFPIFLKKQSSGVKVGGKRGKQKNLIQNQSTNNQAQSVKQNIELGDEESLLDNNNKKQGYCSC